MARKARAEVEGGLYHVITRGNNRRQIFNSPADYEKFLSLLAVQKIKLPFFLYAYCLMSNHVHLLIERQASAVGRIMHRLLTGYAQYYNRRYRRVGHLLQGRYELSLLSKTGVRPAIFAISDFIVRVAGLTVSASRWSSASC